MRHRKCNLSPISFEDGGRSGHGIVGLGTEEARDGAGPRVLGGRGRGHSRRNAGPSAREEGELTIVTSRPVVLRTIHSSLQPMIRG